MNCSAVLWWDDLGETGPDAPELNAHLIADVCVVGGGFTGLWTALEIKQQRPEVSVVLIEAERCGAGASGRNGGWATGWYDELPELIDRFGHDEALWLAEQSSRAIGRIDETARSFGFDCDFRQRGALWTSTAPAQDGAWGGAVDACDRMGHRDKLEVLDGTEVRRRTGSPLPRGAARHTDAASVHPAKLVCGLRAAALALGVQLYEHTRMRRLVEGSRSRVVTPAGSVTADQVVLATNVGLLRRWELRRAAVPAGSHVVATAPIPDRLRGLDWANGELFGDARLQVHYAQVTTTGRVVFGRGGGHIGPAGRSPARYDFSAYWSGQVAADFRRFFPQFADVPLTHAWGGTVDRAPGHLPFVGELGEHHNIHYALGYSGNGVAPSALIGRILGRRALRMRDRFTSCALVNDPPAYLPPEPFRTIGGYIVQAAIGRAERAEEAGRPAGRTAAAGRRLLWTTMPRWAEPRLHARPRTSRDAGDRI